MEEYAEVQSDQKNIMKQPWLAVFLSALWPGAGQMYGGEKARGVFFMAALFSFMATTPFGVYGFVIAEDAGTARQLLLGALLSGVLVLLLGISMLFDAYAITAKYNAGHGVFPERNAAKKPWLAVFLSYLFPGIGHLYTRQTVRGIMLLIAALAVFAAASEYYLYSLALIPLSVFAMKDAFDSAGNMNGSNVRFLRQKKSLLLLVVVMTALHAFPFEELVKTRLMQAYKIPTGSMLPTLKIGDQLLVDKSKKARNSIARGDVVVFRHPSNPEKKFIKRVIGTGGDTIEVIDGKLYVNEQVVSALPVGPPDAREQERAYPRAAFYEEQLGNVKYRIQRLVDRIDQSMINEGPWLVPKDSLFVIGDNRDNSQDSRQWGFVPGEYVEGRPHKIYWSWDSGAGRVRWDRIGRTIQ